MRSLKTYNEGCQRICRGLLPKCRAVSTDSNDKHATGTCARLRRENAATTQLREYAQGDAPPCSRSSTPQSPVPSAQNPAILLFLHRPIRLGIINGLFCGREDSPCSMGAFAFRCSALSRASIFLFILRADSTNGGDVIPDVPRFAI
jgi:hypothetical protein